MNYRIQVGQLRHGVERDIMLRGTSLTKLLRQKPLLVWMSQQKIDGTHKHGRRRLAARRRQEGERGVNRSDEHALLAAIRCTNHVLHDVWSVHLPAQPAIDFLGDLLDVLLAFGFHRTGYACLQETREWREETRGDEEAGRFDAPEEEADPRVIQLALETVERLAEREVPEDIERSEVEPGDEIDRRALTCIRAILSFAAGGHLLTQPLHEQADVLLDDGLLVGDGAVSKGGREDAAHARVLVGALRGQ